jgi:hypothetical protein
LHGRIFFAATTCRPPKEIPNAVPSNAELEEPASTRDYPTEVPINVPGDAYKDIPYIGLAKRMLHLGHLYLGPLQNWPKARQETRAKAADCFIATLKLCLDITLIKDPKSPYCELSFSKYCQPDHDGVLALVGLAELAVTSGDATEWARSGRLLSFAKLLYKLHYGEDRTFDNHHKTYLFRHEKFTCTIPPEEFERPENWDEIEASATAKPRQNPLFLH